MNICLILRLLEDLEIDVDPRKHRDRMIIQKIGYIIQEMLNRDLSYRFKWYTYGPYSRELSKEVTSIDLCIKSMDKNSKLYEEDLNEILSQLIKVIDICRDIQKPLHKCLEMITSIHMIAVKTYPKSKDPITDLIKLKPYMDKESLKDIYTKLLSMGYI